jgi:signal peptidase I
MMVVVNLAVFGFWQGVKLALRTEYPALAVASTSMLPTLNVGDLIIVQGVPPDQIYANYINGDLIVFRSPYNTNELIVHRAVKKEQINEVYYFTTHGDNNPTFSAEGPFPENYLIGKVMGRIPNVGNLALLFHSEQNMYLFIIALLIFIILILSFLSDSEKETEKAKHKLFGVLEVETIYILAVNILLIGFIVFNIWGSFTFWQPGAEMNPKWVTVQGMYPDIQFHQSFKRPYNNVGEVFLIHGFLTYTINCLVSDGIHVGMRPGVPTFSSAQLAIIILVLFDFWKFIKFIKSSKDESYSVN